MRNTDSPRVACRVAVICPQKHTTPWPKNQGVVESFKQVSLSLNLPG
jgi:hypothetical protein